MTENDIIVEDNSTEIVETTTEEIVETKPTPKTYTQEEVNEIVGRRLARNEARIKKEYEKKVQRWQRIVLEAAKQCGRAIWQKGCHDHIIRII